MTVEARRVIDVLTGSPSDTNPEARRARLAADIASAPDADLLVLPFMTLSRPFWTVIDRAAGFKHGEREPFPSIAAIASAVKERGIPTLATVYAVVAEGVFYSTAVMIDADGSSRAFYRQEHAVNEPGWHERLYFQPGVNAAPALIDNRGFSIGLLLGGDLWIPEAARRLRLAGATALLSVSGAPDSMRECVHALAQARSIENGVPVIWSSRDGTGLKARQNGVAESMDLHPWYQVTLDPAAIRSSLNHNDPLRLRRPRLYQSLVKTWEESAG
jgi:predicted amidohydrolase